MGQKLLLLLDSEMTCDVKRLFSLWQWTVVLHAVRRCPAVCCCQTSTWEFWVMRALGQESHQDISKCYTDFPAYKVQPHPQNTCWQCRTLQTTDMLKLRICLWSVFNDMLWQHCAYGLVKFRHRNHHHFLALKTWFLRLRFVWKLSWLLI